MDFEEFAKVMQKVSRMSNKNWAFWFERGTIYVSHRYRGVWDFTSAEKLKEFVESVDV